MDQNEEINEKDLERLRDYLRDQEDKEAYITEKAAQSRRFWWWRRFAKKD